MDNQKTRRVLLVIMLIIAAILAYGYLHQVHGL